MARAISTKIAGVVPALTGSVEMKRIVALLLVLLIGLFYSTLSSWSIELSGVSDRSALVHAMPVLLLLGAVVLALTELTTLRPMNDDDYGRPQTADSYADLEATYGQGYVGSRRSHATFVAGGSRHATVAGRLDSLASLTPVTSSSISSSSVPTNVG
jgi:hypothetical protein